MTGLTKLSAEGVLLRIAHFADIRVGRKEEGAKGIQPNAQRRGLVPYLVRVARSRWSLGREEGEGDGRTVGDSMMRPDKRLISYC